MTRTPAICGGPPAFPNGPPVGHTCAHEVREALARSVDECTWNRYHGPSLAALVERLRELTTVEHVSPCSSGTVATEIALRGLGVGPGDEVVLGGYDFPGNFRAIEAVGARPVLVDLNATDRCLAVASFIEACGPETKAVVATHLHGGLVDMPALCEAAVERGVRVVEDACQVVGASIAGRPVGSWGDVATLSFGGSKLLSAGRGGAVLTRFADVAQRMKIYCERGNEAFPLSELQATVLLPQLEVLAEATATRRANAARFLAGLRDAPGLSGIVPRTSDDRRPGDVSAYYKLGLWFDAAACGDCSRELFVAAVRAEGIALDAGFRGFTSRSSRRCRRVGPLPIATAAAERTVVLHHPLLLEDANSVDRAAAVVAELAELFARRRISIDASRIDSGRIERDTTTSDD